MLEEPDRNDEWRVERAHRLAFGRPPTAEENAQTLEFIDSYQLATATPDRPAAVRRLSAWQSFCQTLLCSNEFVFIE